MNFRQIWSEAEIVRCLDELYQSILGRRCDQSGLETYGKLLRDGKTLDDISTLLKGSEEFLNRACSASSQLEVLRHLDIEFVTPVAPIPGRLCYVLHNSLPQASGGYATRSHGLAMALDKTGYEMIAVTRPGYPQDLPGSGQPDAADLSIDGVRYCRIAYPQRRRQVPLGAYMDASIQEFEKCFRRYRPAAVMAASFYTSALPALIAARRLDIPCIYEIRGLAELTFVSRNPAYRHTPDYETSVRMECETANIADHVFTLTAAMRAIMEDRGVPGDRITVLPNACDSARFSPRPRDEVLAERLDLPAGVPVIGYVGSIVDYEGLDDLMQACSQLNSRDQAFRLMIVGSEHAVSNEEGALTRALRIAADAGGFSDWLRMVGRIPHERVDDYYSLIDIVPYPRKPWPVCEAVTPIKPFEALALGKAVVVSSVAALKEVIRHGETGLVFEKGNVNSLADALQTLIEQPGLRVRLGAQGRRFVQQAREWTPVAAICTRQLAELGVSPDPARSP
jgi:glycosyltransferase involved in cell wall biosynthesis